MNPVNLRWIERVSQVLLGARGYYKSICLRFQPDVTYLILEGETFHTVDLEQCRLDDQPYVSRDDLISKLTEGKTFSWYHPELSKLLPLIAECAPVASTIILNIQPTVTYLKVEQGDNEQHWCLNDEGLFVANGTTSAELELPCLPGARWAAYKSRTLHRNLARLLTLIETLAKEKS